jgi:adenylate kinase
MKNIIVFGPPGTGKGTVSKRLSEEFGLKHISTGDIIRKNQEEKTKIGQLADKIVDGGNLLPDNIVNEMIKQEIIDNPNVTGFIFDGYPRTAEQAKVLDQFLNQRGTPVSKAIFLNTPKWVVLNRIIDRGRQSGRKDDTQEIFGTRWEAYQKQTVPALNYFTERGRVIEIDGDREMEVVYSDCKNVIDGIA